jgi:POT family proton-dependent oligopeptide transporter
MQTLDQIRNFEGKYPKPALVALHQRDVGALLLLWHARHAHRVHGERSWGWTTRTANLQYGAIQAFVYAFTFIGGVFADKILGFQKVAVLGAAIADDRRAGW